MTKLLTLTWLILSFGLSLYGQPIDGGTGADGPFSPPTQIPMGTEIQQGNCVTTACIAIVPLREPPNHVFNFTTVTIGTLVTVRFRRNMANTPVIILAQDNVTIAGTIDVNGQPGTPVPSAALGGPGGFNGGLGGVYIGGGDPGYAGAGGGPGGGGSGCSYGTGGGFGGGGGACTSSESGTTYGIPDLQPIIGGSGGSGGAINGTFRGGNGGGGGGALLIASSRVIDLSSGSNPAITANGGNGENVQSNYHGGGGSGGGIRLVAMTLRGTRSILANGGSAGGPSAYGGGGGRIRLESVQLSEYTGTTSPPASATKPGPQGPVFPPITPTVQVTSIGGFPVPAQPTFDISTPDVTLPANFANPVRVELAANNVPSGTRVRVFVAPQFGRGQRVISQSVQLTGSAGDTKRAAVEIPLPTRGVGVISALIDSVIPEPPASGNEKQ